MLTTAQSETIQEPNEHKLVLALPGSGKTHTSVQLTKRIIDSDSSSRVLMTTFTNAAASEMRVRLEKELGKFKAKRTSANTFASLMLLQFKPLQQGRRCIMGAEQTSYVKRALNALGFDTDELSEWCSAIDEVSRELNGFDDGTQLSKVFNKYLEILNQYRRYDLNMMARELILGMQQGTVQPLRYSHIICDEFQDTDKLQYAWLKAHGDGGCYITVVGDDDQSIYSWRGSMGYNGFVLLQEDFDASGYLLDTCFRCAPNILYTSKRFIEHNHDRIDKEMYSAKSEKGDVQLIEIPKGFISKRRKKIEDSAIIDNKEERLKELKTIEHYHFVAEKIEDSGEVCTVLARTNKQLDNVEGALAELKIDVHRIGGKSIFDNIHAVGIINLFYGLVYPRAANCLEMGLGWLGESEQSINNIFKISSNSGFGAVNSLDIKCKSVTMNLQNASVGWASCNTSIETEANIKLFNKEVKSHILRVKDKEHKFQSAILEVCVNMLMSSKGNMKERAAYLFDKISNTKNKQELPKDKVVLATMNGSKGLEWPHVWIIDVEDTKVPLMKDTDADEKLEEERRLLFVAMTRAEKSLKISYREGKESQFIEEII